MKYFAAIKNEVDEEFLVTWESAYGVMLSEKNIYILYYYCNYVTTYTHPKRIGGENTQMVTVYLWLMELGMVFFFFYILCVFKVFYKDY